MSNRPDTADYRTLIEQGVPMMDMRAPVEFAQGAFPGVVNLPIMTDDERARVGTCYKQQGQDAAIALGHQLVSGAVKAQRVAAWAEFAQQNPSGYLYCFRGGLRSQIAQRWLAEAGIDYPRVTGGYKALRQFVLQSLEDMAARANWTILGGMTGTGKTDVVLQLSHALDLEGIANHRGSSFGKHATPQPTQINFEGLLAQQGLRLQTAGHAQWVLEDESRLIGRCALPLSWQKVMQTSPVVWLQASFDERVERILRDYVIDLHHQFVALLGAQQGQAAFAERLIQSLTQLNKRLGGERTQRLLGVMQQALQAEDSVNHSNLDLHRDWIAALLREYYDPMYEFQMRSKRERIVFKGDANEVKQFLLDLGT
ncbi:MAG: hypothetical protein RLZZ397_640 [Pseudomonadota bacterium]